MHLNEDISNHLTLLLKLYRIQVRNGGRNKLFMFENIWVQGEIGLQTGGEGSMGNRPAGQPMEKFNLQDGNMFEGIVEVKARDF